jgi:hypothetical protein
MKCNICDENFNKSKHLAVNCPYCSFEACRTCCEKYILDQTIAKCMNPPCDKVWTRNEMVKIFTKSFINNEWKLNKEKVLFDKEIALLPATQPIIEEEIRKEKIWKEIDKINNQINKLKFEKEKLASTINIKKEVESKIFMRACPDENCRGFLSTKWKCGLCEKYTCPECHVLKGNLSNIQEIEHVCNPDDLATAKLLDKDTKCCPKCSTGIFKIEGCDQMWCIMCHTGFSWKTGRIETNIHNPHFYEWQRKNGTLQRNNGDIPCGRVLDHQIMNEVENIIRLKLKLKKPINLPEEAQIIMNKFSFLIPRLIHLERYDIQKYTMDHVENNVDLRKKYMRNLIDKETFKITIQRRNKQFEKNNEMYQILNLYITTMTEIIYRIIDAIRIKSNIIDYPLIFTIFDEIDPITEYVNECFKNISFIYGSVLKKISYDNKNINQILV